VTLTLALVLNGFTPLLRADEVPPTGVSKPEDERLICKRERVTGTNFKRRVCRTRAQIEAARRKSLEFANELDQLQRDEQIRQLQTGQPIGL
jgi:hypothetical protein